ncbi:methylated-DNA--[protein]-cysteine S-methyltransferase [Alteromonas sp. C1M14]|uniref:methylated-DNA--[protein]-cysteine S-methyltransferase n=1 Tax=Alteromonas sp. C1M14 TaxID=2841567 RepID=UPI001C0851E7|nr:methylated-DNA--[protein]-cysteine S-methyltransferase [Alteromonas sp. C1M14]MBU2978265.1 methylated-DNA--[protein]-cysteine S-methyltransferase [Alteromonas sp. C1M14]
MYNAYMPSPCGLIQVCANNSGITAIRFVDEQATTENPSSVTELASQQLQEYFASTRREFSLPLAAEGTAFQREVWTALSAIPYGETRTYGDIARSINNPKAVRAVGLANGKNPLSIVVPCHRVIGANGTLTGYAGGLTRKARLLKLEGVL